MKLIYEHFCNSVFPSWFPMKPSWYGGEQQEKHIQYLVNMGCLCKHVYLKMQLKMRFSTSFEIKKICKKYFFSFYSLLFLITQWRWSSKIGKALHGWMEWKMPLSKSHTFWMAAWLICCFIVILYTERNLATILPLNSKLSGKFQPFNAINGCNEMLKNSWISEDFN